MNSYSFRETIDYHWRSFCTYFIPVVSHCTFWHELPEEHESFVPGELGPYYMRFRNKARYAGPFDSMGVPLLNYHGKIGLQYNPIAIAQFGLGNFNDYLDGKSEECRRRYLCAADWLLSNLEKNSFGLSVWNHHFDWRYAYPLKAPWYSGLAQGQGISLLVRAYHDTRMRKYLDAAQNVFKTFSETVDHGGVVSIDSNGDPWIEEYLVDCPAHILNGFIWALWGVYDYLILTHDIESSDLFGRMLITIKKNLWKYDIGFWSCYDLANKRIKTIASPLYHKLHIVQLKILSKLTKERYFDEVAVKWEKYQRSEFNRARAFAYKAIFKLCYY